MRILWQVEMDAVGDGGPLIAEGNRLVPKGDMSEAAEGHRIHVKIWRCGRARPPKWMASHPERLHMP
jgi:hypothetical protein